jgi:sec-independent protein translocase protein TatA
MTTYLNLAFSPGMPEILLVLAVILIFFGAKKLPELAKGMGQGIKEFKKATKDIKDEDVNICFDFEGGFPVEEEDVECIIKGKKCIVKHTREYKKACIAIPIDEKEDFSNF